MQLHYRADGEREVEDMVTLWRVPAVQVGKIDWKLAGKWHHLVREQGEVDGQIVAVRYRSA